MKTGLFECPSATDYSGNCMLLDAWLTTVHWKHHIANLFLTKHQTLAIQYSHKKTGSLRCPSVNYYGEICKFQRNLLSIYTWNLPAKCSIQQFHSVWAWIHTVCFLVKSFVINYLQLPVICR
jgi:hypothetical protein